MFGTTETPIPTSRNRESDGGFDGSPSRPNTFSAAPTIQTETPRPPLRGFLLSRPSLNYLEDPRPDLKSAMTSSAHGQLTRLRDPPPVLSEFPFGQGTERFKIDVRPGSEGDEQGRHVMGDFHTAHARLFSASQLVVTQ